MTAPSDDHLPPTTEFSCPRCAGTVRERFYGPCDTCRQALVAAADGGRRADAPTVTTERFEPRMSVVPNHVATKD